MAFWFGRSILAGAALLAAAGHGALAGGAALDPQEARRADVGFAPADPAWVQQIAHSTGRRYRAADRMPDALVSSRIAAEAFMQAWERGDAKAMEAAASEKFRLNGRDAPFSAYLGPDDFGAPVLPEISHRFQAAYVVGQDGVTFALRLVCIGAAIDALPCGKVVLMKVENGGPVSEINTDAE